MKTLNDLYIGDPINKEKVIEDISNGVQKILDNYNFEYNNSKNRDLIKRDVTEFLLPYIQENILEDFKVSVDEIDDKTIELNFSDILKNESM